MHVLLIITVSMPSLGAEVVLAYLQLTLLSLKEPIQRHFTFPRLFPGPTQTSQSSYPPSGCYGAPPQQHGYSAVPVHAAAAPNKAPFANTAKHYHSNQQQHLLQQCHVASTAYNAPLSSAPPSQPSASLSSARLPPPNAQHIQQHPYPAPGPYSGHPAYHAPPAQPPQPRLVSAPAGGPGAPLVSSPSAPGANRYGSMASSQSGSALGGLTTQVAAPLHHYSGAQPASTLLVQHGYGTAPPAQPVLAVNGQGGAGLLDGKSVNRNGTEWFSLSLVLSFLLQTLISLPSFLLHRPPV